MSEHAGNMDELDMRLDRAIDALNAERAPLLFADDDPELVRLVDAARIARRLREPDWPDDAFPTELAEGLAARLVVGDTTVQRRPDNGRVELTATPDARPRRLKRLVLLAAAALRALGVTVLAGMLAGALAGGLGGRVVMRVSGLLYEREHPGVVTVTESSGEPVGQISFAGTLELVLEAMFLGIAGGLAYALVRYWLPGSERRRGLIFGALLALAAGTTVINRDNADFQRLGSPVLNVLMFAALLVLFGMLVAPLRRWLDRAATPAGRWLTWRAPASVAVYGAGLVALPIVMLLLATMLVMPLLVVVEFVMDDATVADLAAALALSVVFPILPAIQLLRSDALHARLASRPAGARGAWVLWLGQHPRTQAVALVLAGLAIVLGGTLTLWNVISIVTS